MLMLLMIATPASSYAKFNQVKMISARNNDETQLSSIDKKQAVTTEHMKYDKHSC